VTTFRRRGVATPSSTTLETEMNRVREIGLMLLTAAIIFFAGQNLGPVEVVFLAWRFQVPLALITLVPLLAGLLIGVGATAIMMRKRRRDGAGAADEQEPAEGSEAEAAVQDEEEE
jgi:uncharacterized integral membrane protein